MSNADKKKHIAEIKEQGYTIVEGVLSADEADALVADVERLEAELSTRPARNPFEGQQTMRTYNLLIHGQSYQDIATNPRVLPIVEGILDSGCLVSSISAIAIMPGEIPQPLHADDQLIPLKKPHAPIVCNSMWALTDFTEANGATRIVPGSHTRDSNPNYGQAYDTIPAEMSKGSVMVYDGAMWHGGGTNTTDARRIGIAMNYCAGFIRQQENQQLGIPRDVARTFSPRLRELVGYSVYNRVIGHINRKHPGKLLD